VRSLLVLLLEGLIFGIRVGLILFAVGALPYLLVVPGLVGAAVVVRPAVVRPAVVVVVVRPVALPILLPTPQIAHLQQLNELVREDPELHQYALVPLQVVEVVLPDLELPQGPNGVARREPRALVRDLQTERGLRAVVARAGEEADGEGLLDGVGDGVTVGDHAVGVVAGGRDRRGDVAEGDGGLGEEGGGTGERGGEGGGVHFYC